MKKGFYLYIVCWIILFSVFNIIIFTILGVTVGLKQLKFTFWIMYFFVCIAFICQILCGIYAFNRSNTKLFYSLPLITSNYLSLIFITIVGILFIVVPWLPGWIGVILCLAIISFNIIQIIKIGTTSEIILDMDKKIQANTSFVYSLTIEMESLLESVGMEDLKTEIKRVLEAIRYSDPISTQNLSSTESYILEKNLSFKEAIAKNDLEKTKQLANELLLLISKRNKECKLYK